MKKFALAAFALIGCGSAVEAPLPEAESGTGESGSVEAGPGTGAENPNLPQSTSGGADESTGEDDQLCPGGPTIVSVVEYAGTAERTVGRDLLRGDDGVLYLAGAMADASMVGQWIAATTADGHVLWELVARQRESPSLRSSSIVQDIALTDGQLHYGGYGEGSVLGVVDPEDGSGEETDAFDDLAVLGFAQSGPSTTYVVGRRARDGVLRGAVVRRDGTESTWDFHEARTQQANAVLLDGGTLYVAGQRDELPWVGLFDPESGGEVQSWVVDSGTTFTPGGGGMKTLLASDDAIIALGSLQLRKANPDGPGTVRYNEVFARAWTRDGQPAWTWQPPAEVVRSGELRDSVLGPDGTVFATGVETERGQNGRPIVAAIDSEGALLWSLSSADFGEAFDHFHGEGIVLGEPGQLFVLTSNFALQVETTRVIEICY